MQRRYAWVLEIQKDSHWLDEAFYLSLCNMKETDPFLPTTIIFPANLAVMTQASDSVSFRQSVALAQDSESE